jgi:hypothetical protein
VDLWFAEELEWMVLSKMLLIDDKQRPFDHAKHPDDPRRVEMSRPRAHLFWDATARAG